MRQAPRALLAGAFLPRRPDPRRLRRRLRPALLRPGLEPLAPSSIRSPRRVGAGQCGAAAQRGRAASSDAVGNLLGSGVNSRLIAEPPAGGAHGAGAGHASATRRTEHARAPAPRTPSSTTTSTTTTTTTTTTTSTTTTPRPRAPALQRLRPGRVPPSGQRRRRTGGAEVPAAAARGDRRRERHRDDRDDDNRRALPDRGPPRRRRHVDRAPGLR